MIVVLVIGMLASIASANYRRATDEARKSVCINNLRQIDSAKSQWAIEHYEPGNTTPTPEDLDPFIKGGIAKIFCPADSTKTFATSYDIKDLDTNAACRLVPTKHVVPAESS